jgi:hypothetical protein
MADNQKEAFRKYLESAGVIDALTKGLHAPCFATILRALPCSDLCSVLSDNTVMQCWCPYMKNQTSQSRPLSEFKLASMPKIVQQGNK